MKKTLPSIQPSTARMSFTLFFILLLLLLNCLSASAQNLITNGNFESGGAGTGTGFVCQIVNIGFEDILQTNAFYPSSTLANRVVAITVYYENTGSIDLPIPIRYFISLGGAPISFTTGGLVNNDKDLTLEFKEDGGPPNVLRAGANGFIKVYSKSTAPLEFIIAE